MLPVAFRDLLAAEHCITESSMNEEKGNLGTWVRQRGGMVVWQVHGGHPLAPSAAACLLGCAAAVPVGACHKANDPDGASRRRAPG